ncbi:MAG: hypothetical protein ABW133_22685, partial [Polyangiaceae bacterium]
REKSPGVGDCFIEINSSQPSICDPSRGWTDPRDADGVRRPRRNARGETVCEGQPVVPEHMEACAHDPLCADCGSGWCVTDVWPKGKSVCSPPVPENRIRWVGGIWPDSGRIRVTCRKAD